MLLSRDLSITKVFVFIKIPLERSNHRESEGKDVVWDGSSFAGMQNDTFSNREYVMPNLRMCHCDQPAREYALGERGRVRTRVQQKTVSRRSS